MKVAAWKRATDDLGKLNNKREVQSEKRETDLENSLNENTTQTKSKEAKSKTRKQIESSGRMF